MIWLSLLLIACGDAGGAGDGPQPHAGSGGQAAPEGGVDGAHADGAVGGSSGSDAGQPLPDGGPDAASDAAAMDGSVPDAGPAMLPATLSETGLYADGSSEELAAGVVPYSPRYALWSDGASKRRWLHLPQGSQIDTSDMDSWVFPPGTKVWKEFSSEGKRIETRLLWKTERAWLQAAYLWNDDESEAMVAPRGAQNARGTTHDVPERGACSSCHEGRPDFLLGVSAIQLAHENPGATLGSLAAEGRLSDPPEDVQALALPDTPAWNALGYLHANCGNCHNPDSDRWDRVKLELWLRVAELGSAEATRSYASTVGVALTDTDMNGGLSLRIAPGEPAMSGLIQRMGVRGDESAMPPLASERVDTDGIALLSDWIDDL